MKLKLLTIPQQIISSRLCMLLLSIAMSFMIWNKLHMHIKDSCWLNIPILFDNHSELLDIQAPATALILISGSRYLLDLVEQEQPAIHVDLNKLTPGRHHIALESKNLLIPSGITVHAIKPYAIEIIITDLSA